MTKEEKIKEVERVCGKNYEPFDFPSFWRRARKIQKQLDVGSDEEEWKDKRLEESQDKTNYQT